jgi:TQXA domain-containing protein
VNRVKKLRTGAALLGVSAIALMAAAIPANADAATGTLDRSQDQDGLWLNVGGEQMPTKLFALKVNGTVLRTYCVDFHTAIPDKNIPPYVEVPWNKHPAKDSKFNKNGDKINWLLHNGYPEVKSTELQAAVQKAHPDFKFADGLSDKEALAATQAAAWFFSDDVKLDETNPTPRDEKSAEDVKKTYAYLTGDTNKGIPDQPKPELTLSPKSIAGTPGTLIGPFTVTTNAPDVIVSAKVPSGVLLTDKDGNKLPDAGAAKKTLAASDKYDFYVKVPAESTEGKAEIDVKGNSTLTLGRLFISNDWAHNPSQGMILAKTETVPLETTGEATWNVAGNTTPILAPVVLGVVLVAGGVGALLFQRRRRKA